MKVQTYTFSKPPLDVIVKEGEKHLWYLFHPHHYMTADKPVEGSLPVSAMFYTFYWMINNQEILIGCAGALFQISKKEEAKRLTRVVVLPEYQGLGFGSLIVNTLGEFYTKSGYKLYSATYHPRLGEFREASKLWEGTHYNLREFKENDNLNGHTITGLRDGDKMYRHSFVLSSSYDLLFDPIDLAKKKREIKLIKREETKEHNIKRKELNAILKLAGEEEVQRLKALPDMNEETHQKAKAEHSKLFNKNKRKKLTPEERKSLKEAKKKEKDEQKDT